MAADDPDLTGLAFWLVFVAVLAGSVAVVGVFVWAVIELVGWVTTK